MSRPSKVKVDSTFLVRWSELHERHRISCGTNPINCTMQLSGEYGKIIPIVTGVAALGVVHYLVYRWWKYGSCCGPSKGGCACGDACACRGKVNHDVEKDKDKVATTVNASDIAETTAYCRCWRSKKFPHCDGSHNAHNQETGDNVGPVVIKK